ncbi:hypothetical protein BpHYR1_008126 [Brachionus plicatilis]|uniref:Uncharacterized protein n=1 Tax=Brachionus plicatilis TaxID=10195 RepID=A0A3M7R2E1_BRAPC|nr:hypothetical protein BpHYR1_008126 [Brachionus plicatilis]
MSEIRKKANYCNSYYHFKITNTSINPNFLKCVLLLGSRNTDNNSLLRQKTIVSNLTGSITAKMSPYWNIKFQNIIIKKNNLLGSSGSGYN